MTHSKVARPSGPLKLQVASGAICGFRSEVVHAVTGRRGSGLDKTVLHAHSPPIRGEILMAASAASVTESG